MRVADRAPMANRSPMRPLIEHLRHDVRVGIRSLRRNRTFTIVTACTLSLGVALNATVFSVVDAALLRPLPYADPERLVTIANAPPGGGSGFVSPAEVIDYRRLTTTVAQVALVQTFNANVTGGERPDRTDAAGVSPNFFALLGVPPFLGRTFVPADERPGFTEIAVISYGLWQRAFGASPGAIGRTMRLDDDDYTIVGVMPPSFTHPGLRPGAPIEIWLPAGFAGAPWPTTSTHAMRLGEAVARLRAGATVADAQHDFDRINRTLVSTYPTDYASGDSWTITVRPLRTMMAGDNGRALALLLGAVALVLLVTCANVSSMAVARGSARRAEMAVRAAMGAVPRQLARTLLVEHLLLAGMAGVLAVLLTFAGVGAARALAPVTLPGRDAITVDGRVLAFALAATVLVGLLVGALPSLTGARTPLAAIMRTEARSAVGRSGGRTRRLLMTVEIALAVVLLAGAGLLARSFWKLHQVELGFEPADVAMAEVTVSLPNDRTKGAYVNPAARARYYDEILRAVRAIPGVESAAGSSSVPLRDELNEMVLAVEGRPPLSRAEAPRALQRAVSADYFAVMKTPIVRGRAFTEQDRMGAPPVAVVSETMARRLFTDEDPIGKRFKPAPVNGPAPWITIVGVARDARLRAVNEPPGNEIYLSMAQSPRVTMAILLRARRDAGAVAAQIPRAVHGVDPNQPVYHVQEMSDVVSVATAERRFAALLLAVFAALSLGLSAIGVYGLVAQSVAERRREMGLRMALGATPAGVHGLVLREAFGLALVGLGLGMGLALALTRLLENQLYGVSVRDPLVLGAIGPTLLLVAFVAAYLPARTAARLDPVEALRV